LGNGYLSERLGGGFALLHLRASADAAGALTVVDVSDSDEALIARFGLTPGAGYLIRPDRHVAARFYQMEQGALSAALSRAGAA
jgi:3-(3-hydroxy-phenyl)propionate hydroxylase